MSRFASRVRTFLRDESGATTAEYGIIVVVIAGIALAVLLTLENGLENLYTSAGTKMENAATR